MTYIRKGNPAVRLGRKAMGLESDSQATEDTNLELGFFIFD